MPDETGKFDFTLSPEVEAAIKTNLDMMPTIRAAIANLKTLGVDTSGHTSTMDGLESVMKQLLATFGKKI
jgi:hypothetical protein